jgi:hypothetical protein
MGVIPTTMRDRLEGFETLSDPDKSTCPRAAGGVGVIHDRVLQKCEVFYFISRLFLAVTDFFLSLL